MPLIADATSIPCPLCSEPLGSAVVNVDLGTHGRTSGPTDSWEPPEPPSFAGLATDEEITWECDCRNRLSNLFSHPINAKVLWLAFTYDNPKDFVLTWYDTTAEESITIDMIAIPDPDPFPEI